MKRVLIAAGITLSLALGAWIAQTWHVKHRARHVSDYIQQAARRYDVSPALIKAVVWHESRFEVDARGEAGEIGLMQLRKLAAQEWATAEEIESFHHHQVIDPQTNTFAGTWYLKKLLDRYQYTDHPLLYALADYNAGRSNVLRWLEGRAKTNGHAFLNQIDFPGTRAYIQSVTNRLAHYQNPG